MRVSRAFCLLLLSFAAFIPFSCFNNPASSSSFSNKVEIGTQLSGMNLADAGSSFTMLIPPIQLWLRIETEYDQEGKTATVALRRTDNTVWDTTLSIVPPQNYGHILLQNFYLNSRGSYSASVTFPFTPARTVGAANFVVK